MVKDGLLHAPHKTQSGWCQVRPLLALTCCLLATLTVSCGRFEIVDIPKDPIGARGHIDLAVSYETGKEHDLALREYEKAVSIDPSAPDAWFGMGNIHLIKKDWIAASKNIEKAIRLRPTEGLYRNNLAIAYMEAGRLDDGLKAARKGLELDPVRSYIYMDTLGMILTREGKTTLAEKAYEEALTKATAAGANEGEIMDHLLVLYEATGEVASAGLIKEMQKTYEQKKDTSGKEGMR